MIILQENEETLSGAFGKTVRFRITWNASLKLALLEADIDYNGVFIADYYRTFDGSDNFDNTNMAVYFGGGRGVVFEDFILREDCNPDGDATNNTPTWTRITTAF